MWAEKVMGIFRITSYNVCYTKLLRESTDIAVSANEGQYELEPAKVAIIVYCPGMSGGTHR